MIDFWKSSVSKDDKDKIYCTKKQFRKTNTRNNLTDILKSIGILIVASCLGYLFEYLGFAESNIIVVYVLAVLIIAVVTINKIYSLAASAVSVMIFNFLFTEPKFSLKAYDPGYPVTFVIMFIAAFLTGSLAAKLKDSAKKSALDAFRTKVLFETNQSMQKVHTKSEIVSITARQMSRLLNKDIVVYLDTEGVLSEPLVYLKEGSKEEKEWLSDEERKAAQWTFDHNRYCGATTERYSDCLCMYLAIRVNRNVYGVIGIVMDENPIDSFESSIYQAMIGECALALENRKNAKEKEEAAVMAKNEQLQANLLRAISHDLRTPLTSISGNASNLLYNGNSFDDDTKTQLYMDIYDDSMWLISLVENLLSVTRLKEGRLNLKMTDDLIEDVINEALRHINRKSVEHTIKVVHEDEFLLARMDIRLILQVVINIVDNAIKYTQKGSTITITTRKVGAQAVVSIADDGPGIPDEHKKKIFEMFFSGATQIADSHRSLGLGLSLCKTIIDVHGGELTVEDNKPHGTIFTFTLPSEEVSIYE